MHTLQLHACRWNSCSLRCTFACSASTSALRSRHARPCQKSRICSRSSALPIVSVLPLAGGAAPGVCAGNMGRCPRPLRFGSGRAGGRVGWNIIGSLPAARDDGSGACGGGGTGGIERGLGTAAGGGGGAGAGAGATGAARGAFFFFRRFFFFGAGAASLATGLSSSLAYSSSSSCSFTKTRSLSPANGARNLSLRARRSVPGSGACDACAACASCCATAIIACVDAWRGPSGFSGESCPSGSAFRINVRRCAGSDVQYASSSGRPCGSASMRRYRSLAVASRSACTCAVAASDGAMSSSRSGRFTAALRFFFASTSAAASIAPSGSSSTSGLGALAIAPVLGESFKCGPLCKLSARVSVRASLPHAGVARLGLENENGGHVLAGALVEHRPSPFSITMWRAARGGRRSDTRWRRTTAWPRASRRARQRTQLAS